MAEAADITDLLNAGVAGDAVARDAVYKLVYDELKTCARRQGAMTPGSSLTPTALVNELYLKLRTSQKSRIKNRGHFFSIAARAMRQIMIDHARERGRAKRGGDQVHVEVDTQELGATTAEQALELDAALTALSQRDPGLVQVVEWHFFAGLTFQDIADEQGRHERTVRHDWELARAFLRNVMIHGSDQ
jgi:RNA polymerase sigma factor (TIGR02999 family)